MVRQHQKVLRILLMAQGRLVISPRSMRQSVQVTCALPDSFPSISSCYGLVGAHLEAYADKWDGITCNIFMRNVVWNVRWSLLRAIPLHSQRVPIAFESARVGLSYELLSDVVSKLLEKGAIERVEDD